MSKRVMKWATLVVLDNRKELVYRFDDEKGCSLAAWRRYLINRFGSASGMLMAKGTWPYDAYYMNCTQIGELK